MTILCVLIGLPGSGKTTWARQIADRLNIVVVGSDEVRCEFQANAQNPLNGDAVFAEVERRARILLQADRSVILDATHYRRRCDTPLTEALRRNEWRTGDRFGEQRIPDDVIRDIAAHLDPPGTDEFDRVVRIRDQGAP
jgi:predicted kinase